MRKHNLIETNSDDNFFRCWKCTRCLTEFIVGRINKCNSAEKIIEWMDETNYSERDCDELVMRNALE